MFPQKIFRTIVTVSYFAVGVTAQEIKVDINNNGRPVSEGNDPAYTSWSTNSTWLSGSDNSISNTFSGVTVKFTRVDPLGIGFRAGYWKDGVQQSPPSGALYNCKLAADGIRAEENTGGMLGGQIEMRLSGLSPGPHTLLTYHNAWDNIIPSNNTPRLNIYVNGVQVITNLVTTARVVNSSDSATAYLNLDALAGQDVVVLFAANTNIASAQTNVYLNGFEIDTANSTLKAVNPFPQQQDEHVDADNKTVLLRWKPAGSAVSHDVYFGTSSNAVKTATHASPEFTGNQAATNYLATNLKSLLTYFWRVDEVNAASSVTKGGLWIFRPRHLAFPGAEGYGRFARGGRGGVVVEVTNTNDSGPGSFRDAIEGNYGPRTVVFTVSGQIILNDDVIISGTTPPITVAGQTAPGKGICFRRQQFAMSGAKDAIVRDVRIRVGKESGETQNGSGMAGVDHAIMDHCSISWGIDEELSTRSAKNMTFQRCHISEALNVAGHQNYPAGTAHGYAASVGGDIASLHHNLLSHNEGRNWSLAGGLDGVGYAGRLDIFNNVVYNWGGRATDGGAHEVNFVNNYYKPGAATSQHIVLKPQYGGFPGTQQYYMVGNVEPGYFTVANQSAGFQLATESGGTLPADSTPPYSATVSSPFFPSYATIDEVTNAYKKVLSDVGCNQPQIDDHDVRVIRETIDGTYTYSGSVSAKPGLPDTTADVGGWEDYGNAVRPAHYDTDHDGLPDWWERIKGFNTNSAPGDFSDSNSDPNGDGYTSLEDYLNWMAGPHADCNAGSSVDVDLAALTRGFTNNSPKYLVFNAVNGTVVTNGNGKTACFTPTVSTGALGGFTYTVTDANGYNMTQTIGIHIVDSIANTAPVFVTSSSDRVINVGVNLSITNEATDSDTPLTYSLPVKPVGAVIGSVSGVFQWRPAVTDSGTTNPVTVRVSDNGSPGLSVTQAFNVVVNPLALPAVSAPQVSGGQIGFTINGQAGPDYAVQSSSNLADWTTLWITNPAVMPFSWIATNDPAKSAQFYRIKTGPPLP